MAIVDGTTYNPWTGELDKTLSDTYLDSGWLRLDASNDPLTGDLNFSGAYGAYFRDGNTWIYSGGSGSLGLVATSQILMTTNAVQIGKNNNEDISLTFNASSNDGTLTWMEDENYFSFGNNVTLGGNKLTADVGIFTSGVTSTSPSVAGSLALYAFDGSANTTTITINGATGGIEFSDSDGNTLSWLDEDLNLDSGDLTTTGTGTFGTLDGSSITGYGQAYFENDYSDIVTIFGTSTLDVYNGTTGHWAELAGADYSYKSGDSAFNEVILTDGTYAINAIGALSLDSGSFTTDGYGNIIASTLILTDAIYDIGQVKSIDQDDRQLLASDGSTVMLDWSTDGTLDAGDNNIVTTGSINSNHDSRMAIMRGI